MAGRPGASRMADYTDSLTAEGVPFELLDARRGHAPLAAVAPRRRARPRCSRRRAASPTRSRATPPTGAWRTPARRDPPRPDAGHGHPRRRRRGRGRSPAASTHRARSVVVAADAWTNELLAPVRAAPAADDHQGAGHLLRARRTRRRSRPDRFPVWIWMDDPSFYGFPTYGEAGPEGRPGLRRPADDAGRAAPSSATEAPRARPALPGAATCRAPSGPAIYTKTCLYTLDAGPGLRRRPAARGARASRPARRGPRLQVRLGARPDRWPSSPSTARRRRPPSSSDSGIDRPILLEAAPATSWMV